MTTSPWPPRFLQNHVESVRDVEALLLLREDPQRTWRPESLAQEMRSSPGWGGPATGGPAGQGIGRERTRGDGRAGDEVERVHGVHARFCPVARSLEGAIAVRTERALSELHGFVKHAGRRSLDGDPELAGPRTSLVMPQRNSSPAPSSATIPDRKWWKRDLEAYLEIDHARTLGQIAGVVLPYLGVWALAAPIEPGPWLAAGLGQVATVLLVRMYSFFHDLTHSSMFVSRAANARWGHVLGSCSSRRIAGGSASTACITRTPATSASGDPARSTR